MQPTEWTGLFLGCGILAHGFLRLRCGDCGHDKLVATTRTLLRYEGGVPPMQVDGGKLKNLDARVDDSMLVPVRR